MVAILKKIISNQFSMFSCNTLSDSRYRKKFRGMLRWKEIYIFIAHFVQFSARRNNFGAHGSNKTKSLFKKPSKLDKSRSKTHDRIQLKLHVKTKQYLKKMIV